MHRAICMHRAGGAAINLILFITNIGRLSCVEKWLECHFVSLPTPTRDVVYRSNNDRLLLKGLLTYLLTTAAMIHFGKLTVWHSFLSKVNKLTSSYAHPAQWPRHANNSCMWTRLRKICRLLVGRNFAYYYVSYCVIRNFCQFYQSWFYVM